MDLVALKSELTTDPLSRGYSGMSDEQAADSLNAPDRSPAREFTDAGTLVAAIVRAEYDALATASKAYLNVVLAVSGPIPMTATFRNNLGAIFGAATQTRANFLALQNRTGSRAEELGLGRVTPSHVADARRLP